MIARRTRVLVVDDSVVARRLLSEVLGEDPGLEIVGVAATGQIALAKMAQLRPDVVVLDVEMPEMSGLQLIPHIRRAQPEARIIMFSSVTRRGAEATLDALALGASDYVTKPANTSGLTESRARIKNELTSKIKALHRVASSKTMDAPAVAPATASATVRAALPRPNLSGSPRSYDIVAIGASTGGPNALADVLGGIDAAFPVPIVVVQHMPPVFTRLLAERIAVRVGGRASEAQEGEALKPGRIYIAPGDFHLSLVREGKDVVCRLLHTAPENFCRPAVDVMFRSLVLAFGGNILATVLTGMGQDGLRGSQDIKAVGGTILAQDKSTSVVWGMPGAVANAGLTDEILPLGKIGARLTALTAAQRSLGRRDSVVRAVVNGD